MNDYIEISGKNLYGTCEKPKENPVKDDHKIVRWIGLNSKLYFFFIKTKINDFIRVIFYYIGMTLMFPYMMMITITDFWNYKFRNTTNLLNETILNQKQINFPGYVAITGNVPLALFVILTAVWGYKVGQIKTK